jgi:hypothetical protein
VPQLKHPAGHLRAYAPSYAGRALAGRPGPK